MLFLLDITLTVCVAATSCGDPLLIHMPKHVTKIALRIPACHVMSSSVTALSLFQGVASVSARSAYGYIVNVCITAGAAI